MPIYAYRCESCGFAKDVLQKMSDAPLTDCPECGQSTFRKQLTAAGFQLKGSGWYVTDFRGGNAASGSNNATANAGKDAGPTQGAGEPGSNADSSAGKPSDSSGKAGDNAAGKPAASSDKPAAAPAPAAGAGST